MAEFQDFGKLARFNRSVVVTEKIDGTNSGIQIIRQDVEDEYGTTYGVDPLCVAEVENDQGAFSVYAQSRKRLITPGKKTDNFGFASWVQENAPALVKTLGEGTHFGEWFGAGVQRGYDLKEKYFALFNTGRWNLENTAGVSNLTVVPTIAQIGSPDSVVLTYLVQALEHEGSFIELEGKHSFPNPEGVVVFHTASRQQYKITCHDDETPKSLVNKG